jgi:phage-related protein
MPNIQVPEDSSPAPGGLSKRTLLIGAAILGGGVGLVFLVSRLGKGNVNASTNQPTTSAPDTSALGIGYQNLATQLLGFRGDMSVAQAQTNADLGTLNDSITAATSATQAGNTDLLSALGAESTRRALSDDTLYGMLASYFAGVGQQFGSVQQQVAGVGQQVGAVGQQVAGVGQQVGNLDQRVIGISQQVGQLQQAGAGGATLRDSVLAAFDGGLGDGAEGLARLSAGPVRIVSRAA